MPGVLHGFILAVIYLALVFMILKGILGINITPFLATSAILTAVLGLALQGVLGNIRRVWSTSRKHLTSSRRVGGFIHALKYLCPFHYKETKP